MPEHIGCKGNAFFQNSKSARPLFAEKDKKQPLPGCAPSLPDTEPIPGEDGVHPGQ
jgi:hypothetical protein